MRENDIVTNILDCVESAVRGHLAGKPGIDQDLIEDIALQIRAQDAKVRQHWGRCDVYVPKNGPVKEAAKRDAIAEVKRTGRVAAAAVHYGVSRATMYRLLSAPRKKAE